MKTPILCQQNDILQYHIYALSEGGPWMATDAGFNKMGLYEPLSNLPIHQAKMYPSAIGYKTTSEILFGSRFDAAKTEEMKLPENVGGGAFRQQNGDYVYTLWAETETDQSESATALYSFPESWKLANLKKMGWDFGLTEEYSVISDQKILLTGTPIFLTATSEAIATDIEAINFSIFEVKLSPNVFKNRTFLEMTLKGNANVRLEVFDLQGRKVKEILPLQSMSKGIYRLEIEGQKWKQGIYFLEVNIEGNREVLKMVKL